MRLFSQRNQRKKPTIFSQGGNLKFFALKVAPPNLQQLLCNRLHRHCLNCGEMKLEKYADTARGYP